MCQLLLARGAEADRRSFDGRSPLIFAAQEGRTDVVTLLLEHGADVEATDKKDGHTALMVWCTRLVGRQHRLVHLTLPRLGCDNEGSTCVSDPPAHHARKKIL
jgi:ankyrin repeat protein